MFTMVGMRRKPHCSHRIVDVKQDHKAPLRAHLQPKFAELTEQERELFARASCAASMHPAPMSTTGEAGGDA